MPKTKNINNSMLSSPVNSRAFELKGHLINSSSFYQLTRNS